MVVVAIWLMSVALLAPNNLAAQEKSDSEQQKTEPKLPNISKELKERVARDQKAREAMIKSMQQNASGGFKIDSGIMNELTAIDKENTAWLEKQIETHGWLGKSLVGKSGAHDAWLLVQHADLNLNFQKKCLDLMSKMPTGEVSPVDIAYLTDRVLSAEGKPQRYGTQCETVDGKAKVKNVEDPENLNKRRAELGLEPIEEYLKRIEALYGSQSKAENKKVNEESDK